MSGGHFDYQQYYIDDIANSIEKEIEEAIKPKPPLVWREGVSVFKKIDDWHSMGIYMGFKTYNEAVKCLKKYRGCEFIREYEKDGKRISEFMGCDKLIEVKEIRYQEYEDGEYYPEYTEETIQIFKDAVKILRKAAIYANRIDWFLSGDDGEDNKRTIGKRTKRIGGTTMKKKEFAVGETFQFGLKKLQVVEDKNDFKSACKDCYMQEMCDNFLVSNINIAIGPCEDFGRSDGKCVHFVEVEEEECKR